MALEKDLKELQKLESELKNLDNTLTEFFKEVSKFTDNFHKARNLLSRGNKKELNEFVRETKKEANSFKSRINTLADSISQYVSSVNNRVKKISSKKSSQLLEEPQIKEISTSLEKVNNNVKAASKNLQEFSNVFGKLGFKIKSNINTIDEVLTKNLVRNFEKSRSEEMLVSPIASKVFGGSRGSSGSRKSGGDFTDSGQVSNLERSLNLLSNSMNFFVLYKAREQSTFQKAIDFLFSSKFIPKASPYDLKDFFRAHFGDESDFSKFDKMNIFEAFRSTINEFNKAVINFRDITNYERRAFIQFSKDIYSPTKYFDVLRTGTSISSIRNLNKVIEIIAEVYSKSKSEGVEIDLNEIFREISSNIRKETGKFPSIFSDFEENIKRSLGYLGEGNISFSDIFYEIFNRRFFKGKGFIQTDVDKLLYSYINDFGENLRESGVNLNLSDGFKDLKNALFEQRNQFEQSIKLTEILNGVIGRIIVALLKIDVKKLTSNFTDMDQLNLKNLFKSLKEGRDIFRTYNPFIKIKLLGELTEDIIKKSEISLIKNPAKSIGLTTLSGILSFLGLKKAATTSTRIFKRAPEYEFKDMYNLDPKGFQKVLLYLKEISRLFFDITVSFPLEFSKRVVNFIQKPLAIVYKQVGLLTTAIVGLSAALAVGYGSLYFGLINPLVESAKVSEQRFVRLESALQNTIQAVQEYQKSIEYASKTPFLIQQVSDAAAMLRAFQFDPFAKINESGRTLLDLLGDMAGAMGTDLETATWALIRAQVGEWEIMQNNFQISAKMIPELKGLASGTKEYGEAIVQFLDKQKRFVGGLFKMSQSIQGMQSNIKDFFGVILEYAIGVLDANSMLRGVTFVDQYKEFLRGTYFRVTAKDFINTFQNIDNMLQSTSYSIRRLGSQFEQEFQRMIKDTATLYNLSSQLKGGFDFQEALPILKKYRSEMEGLNQVDKENIFFLRLVPELWQKMSKSVPEDLAKTPESFKLAMAQSLLYGNELTKTLGRILGIILSIIMKLFYPIQRLFEFMVEGVKKFTLSILNFFVPLEKILSMPARLGEDFNKSFNEVALSVVQGMGKSFSITNKQFDSFKERLLQFNRDYAISLMDISEKGANRLIASMTTLERWIMVLAIIGEFAKLYIEDLFNEIWDKTQWFRDIIKEIYTTIGKFVFDVVFDITTGFFEGFMEYFDIDVLKGFFKALRDLVKSLDSIFRDALGIGKNESLLKSISKTLGKLAGSLVTFFISLLTGFLNLMKWLVEVALPPILSGLKFVIKLIEPLLTSVADLLLGVARAIGLAPEEKEKSNAPKINQVSGQSPIPNPIPNATQQLTKEGLFKFDSGSFFNKGIIKAFLPTLLLFFGGFITGFLGKLKEYIKLILDKGKESIINFIEKAKFSIKKLIDPKFLGEKVFDLLLKAGKFLVDMIFGALKLIGKILFKPIELIGNAILAPIKYLYNLITKSKEEREYLRLKKKYEKFCPFADPSILENVCGDKRPGKRPKKGPKTKKGTITDIMTDVATASEDIDIVAGTKKSPKGKTKNKKGTWFRNLLGFGKGSLGIVSSLGMMFMPDLIDYFIDKKESEEIEGATKNIQESQKDIKSAGAKKKNKTLENINNFLKDGIGTFLSIFTFIEPILSLFVSPLLKSIGLSLIRKLGTNFLIKFGLKMLLRAFGFVVGVLIPGAGWIANILMILDLLDDLFGLGIKAKIAEWWDKLVKEIGSWDLSKYWNSFKNWLDEIFKDLVSGFSKFFARVYSGYKYVISGAIFKDAGKLFSKLWDKAKEYGKGILNKFIDWIVGFFKDMMAKITNFFSTNKDSSFFGNIMNDIKNFISNIFDSISNFFKESFQGILNKIQNLNVYVRILLSNFLSSLGQTFSGMSFMILDPNKIIKDIDEKLRDEVHGITPYEAQLYLDYLGKLLKLDKLSFNDKQRINDLIAEINKKMGELNIRQKSEIDKVSSFFNIDNDTLRSLKPVAYAEPSLTELKNIDYAVNKGNNYIINVNVEGTGLNNEDLAKKIVSQIDEYMKNLTRAGSINLRREGFYNV
jgi:methyl-accepting chemotaxis protein